jgi:hypothetical protein
LHARDIVIRDGTSKVAECKVRCNSAKGNVTSATRTGPKEIAETAKDIEIIIDRPRQSGHRGS